MHRTSPVTGTGVPANDIDVPSTLPPGGSFETANWRMHRYASSVRITHLVNAGVRGKQCLEIAIVARYHQDLDRFEVLVPWLLHTMVLHPTPETMVALAKDASLTSPELETHISEVRGVDVETGVIKIEGELVWGAFSMKEFQVTVTALIGNERGSFRQDSHLYNADKRSVPKAYQWARANAARIPAMTRSEIYQGLKDAGVKVRTWG
jgi:hypothetical protein